MPPRVPISAIVTAYQRTEQTLVTLEKLRDCRPSPEEILVHVDGNQKRCEAVIHSIFPEVQVFHSDTRIGPGGGRNKLVAAATHDIVASFDDDSFPLDADYFTRVITLFENFPGAAILCAAVYHQGELLKPDSRSAAWVSDFAGGACAYRRSMFLATSGYVPLPVAYGMEEVDLALRLHAQGGRILQTSWLRVFHDTDLQRHANPEVTAASVANIALLAYLRYPPSLWILGAGQCLNRVLWLMRHGRWRGILRGLAMIPAHLRSHRHYRKIICTGLVRSFLALRRAPVAITA
jgi:GT2 family glycosyltransferase